MLFFTDYKTPSKRYKSYFPKHDLTFDPNTDQKDGCIILTHGVGLIKAINFCVKNKTRPSRIIAINPPDISILSIISKYSKLLDELQSIYGEYLKNSVDAYSFNIHCFRNINNAGYLDKVYYKGIFYYQENTHNPYEVKQLRDKILELCTT